MGCCGLKPGQPVSTVFANSQQVVMNPSVLKFCSRDNYKQAGGRKLMKILQFHQRILCCSIAIVSLGIASESSAQGKGQSVSRIDEVVVTAQRREESAQDVPISITAITADGLAKAGITNTRDLGLVTPGLRYDTHGAYVTPAIRGVTTTLSSNNEANVATYVDGVYQPALLAAIFDLPDVRQVEVLKGPQGTLFGRNATGGAILIKTLAPDLTEFTGRVSAGFSSFNTQTATGFVSVPLVEDKIAFSFSGLFEDTDGYKKNLLRNGNEDGAEIETSIVRGKLRFVPWEGADFTLTGLYSDKEDHDILRNSNWHGNNALADNALAANPPVIIADEPHEFATDLDPVTDTQQTSFSLHGDMEMGPGVFSVTASYLDIDQYLLTDGDNSPFGATEFTVGSYNESRSLELIYSTDQLGSVRAVGGLYYFYKDAGQEPFQANNYQIAIYNRDQVTSYAAFGELTYDITDRLSVTGGLRFSQDEVEADAAIVFGSPVPPASIPHLGDTDWDSVDPRLSVLYELTDDTNIYASYSQGFKSGVYNSASFNFTLFSFQQTPVDPEEIEAYEIGLKSSSGNTTFNAAVFYYDYTDQQVQAISSAALPGGNTILVAQLTNAASSTIWGAEVGGVWQATDAFSLAFGGTYLDAEYDSYMGAGVNTPIGLGVIIPETIDASGNTMIRSPEFSGHLTGQYELTTDSGHWGASATLFGSTEVFHDVAGRVRQPGYAKLNAALYWESLSGNLEVRFWGRNITDSESLNSLISSLSYDAVTYEPRSAYGVDLTYSF